MQDFKSFIKNPIGIIGLFISFVYAIASLVLGIGLKTLTLYERVAFICFIIILPIYVFYQFVNLVKNHHKKLYGPGDFQSDNGFLHTVDDFLKKNEEKKNNQKPSSANATNTDETESKLSALKMKFGVETETEFRAGAVIIFLLSKFDGDEEKKSAEKLLGKNYVEILKKIETDLRNQPNVKGKKGVFVDCDD